MSHASALPTVSVVIPAYNSARFIGEAIDSVLAQDYSQGKIEIIVVDDGSGDGTCQVVAGYDGVRLLRQANAGAAAARNRGMEHCTGEWVALLDSDDVWLPDKLREQFELAGRLPEAGLIISDGVSFGRSAETVFGMCTSIRRCGRRGITERGYELTGRVHTSLIEQNFVLASSVLVRRDLLGSDPFDPNLWGIEDYELWLRLAERTVFAFVDGVLVRKRQHGTNSSDSRRLIARSWMRLVSKVDRGLLPLGPRAVRLSGTAQWASFAAENYLLAGDWAGAARAFGCYLREPDMATTQRILRRPLAANKVLRSVVRKLRRRRD